MRNSLIGTVFWTSGSLLFLASTLGALAQSDPNRGLWVGEVKLQYVNEVSIPLDESNVPIAPDPKRPTPTADIANLRLILHVNGAGQVHLLKEVALLNRVTLSSSAEGTVDLSEGTTGFQLGSSLEDESQLSLVTDERLYSEFPPQPAARIASATFDFGDRLATDGVNGLVNVMVEEVANSVSQATGDLNDASVRAGIIQSAAQAAVPLGEAVLVAADVSSEFSRFIREDVKEVFLTDTTEALAAAAPLPTDSSSRTLQALANASRDKSFIQDPQRYLDTRATDFYSALEALASDFQLTVDQKVREAIHLAATYADVEGLYPRFLAGKIFGDMLVGASSTASEISVGLPQIDLVPSASPSSTLTANADHGFGVGDSVIFLDTTDTTPLTGVDFGTEYFVLASGLTARTFSVGAEVGGSPIQVEFDSAALTGDITIRSMKAVLEGIEGDSAVGEATTEALRIRVAQYDDRRGLDAVDTVLRTMARTAVTLGSGFSDPEALAPLVLEAGREALAKDVRRYALPINIPSLDYNEFVRSDTFLNSPSEIGLVAAVAAVSERRNNALYPLDPLGTLRNAAKAAVANTLRSLFAAAARAVQTEVAMEGDFGPGNGDPRWTADALPGGLNDAALSATIFLPANHPTNPFRHRRHPDHTVGFDIERRVRLDFDAQNQQPGSPSGFGVDRVTGIYREEVFGLHKPLGPEPQTAPIGLKVEGTFQLNRLSLIDQLNAR